MLFSSVCLFLLISVVSYILGSFNSAIVVTKSFGLKEDIRNLGSGNAGFTNVLRNIGVLPAILTFFGDFIKSFIALVFSHIAVKAIFYKMEESLFISNKEFSSNTYAFASLVCGIFIILGHVYPCFFQFKGGKAIVCLLPITLFFDFRVSLLALGVFVLTLFLSKMVSLASIIGTSSLPCFNFLLGLTEKRDPRYLAVTTVLLFLISILVIYRHSGNIKRIKNHTECKINVSRK